MKLMSRNLSLSICIVLILSHSTSWAQRPGNFNKKPATQPLPTKSLPPSKSNSGKKSTPTTSAKEVTLDEKLNVVRAGIVNGEFSLGMTLFGLTLVGGGLVAMFPLGEVLNTQIHAQNALVLRSYESDLWAHSSHHISSRVKVHSQFSSFYSELEGIWTDLKNHPDIKGAFEEELEKVEKIQKKFKAFEIKQLEFIEAYQNFNRQNSGNARINSTPEELNEYGNMLEEKLMRSFREFNLEMNETLNGLFAENNALLDQMEWKQIDGTGPSLPPDPLLKKQKALEKWRTQMHKMDALRKTYSAQLEGGFDKLTDSYTKHFEKTTSSLRSYSYTSYGAVVIGGLLLTNELVNYFLEDDKPQESLNTKAQEDFLSLIYPDSSVPNSISAAKKLSTAQTNTKELINLAYEIMQGSKR